MLTKCLSDHSWTTTSSKTPSLETWTCVERGHLVHSYDDSLANALRLLILALWIVCRIQNIPVGYFFTKGCSGNQLATVVLYIIWKVEEFGLEIVRPYNCKVLGNGAVYAIQLYTPSSRCPAKLCLAFDQSHIIKNVGSQFLARELGGDEKISLSYSKQLCKMLAGSTVKLVRFVTRKHIYPQILKQ